MRISAAEAARKFVDQYYPRCILAVLGGSGSRNDLNPYSDLDLVIIDDTDEEPYRKTTRAYGWIMECFIITRATYRYFFDEGINSANPSLQRMMTEGIQLRCQETGLELLEEARTDLEYGPMPWSSSEVDLARYRITETIEDLKGSNERCELWFTANKLVQLICEFHLRVNRQWIGEGKHLYRLLKSYDPRIAQELESALSLFYDKNNSEAFIALCLNTIAPYGGPLLDGFEQ